MTKVDLLLIIDKLSYHPHELYKIINLKIIYKEKKVYKKFRNRTSGYDVKRKRKTRNTYMKSKKKIIFHAIYKKSISFMISKSKEAFHWLLLRKRNNN